MTDHETTVQAPEQTLQARVAANLRAEMAARNLGSGQLASVLDTGKRAALRRMKGEQGISMTELDRLADWLHVPVTALMARREYEAQR